jgi:TetR/AcrR family transcriptional repressor of nem operon
MSLRETIISESMKLFSLKGYLGTSITDILEATGSSKGGFYNHFSSKEELFMVVLAEAQKIWRQRVLYGLRELGSPLEIVKTILQNYQDRYLKDSETFPGGCIFISFSVELDDQIPHLSAEVNKGFVGFKALLKRLLDQSQALGELNPAVNTETLSEMIFAGMVGASVIYGVDKSTTRLDKSINSLIDFLEQNHSKQVAELTSHIPAGKA